MPRAVDRTLSHADGFVALLALLCLLGAESIDAAGGSPGGTLEARWKTAAADSTARPVTFSFHREELGEGRISVQLGPGRLFAGQYLRITGKRPLARLRIFHSDRVSDDFDDFPSGPAAHRSTGACSPWRSSSAATRVPSWRR
jgi:hypothetical protein